MVKPTCTFWLPRIVQNFSGLGTLYTTMLSALPYACAMVVMVTVAWNSDRLQERRLQLGFRGLLDVERIVRDFLEEISPAERCEAVACSGDALQWTPLSYLRAARALGDARE